MADTVPRTIARARHTGRRAVVEVGHLPPPAARAWVEAAARDGVLLVDTGRHADEPSPGGVLRTPGISASLPPEMLLLGETTGRPSWSDRPVQVLFHGISDGVADVPSPAGAGSTPLAADLMYADHGGLARAARMSPPWVLARVRVPAGSPIQVQEVVAYVDTVRRRLRVPVLISGVFDTESAEGPSWPAEVRERLVDLRRLETRWAGGLGRRLRLGDRDLSDLFRFAEAVAAHLEAGTSPQAFETFRTREMAPTLGRVAAGLLEHLEGETRTEFARFWTTYGTVHTALCDAVARCVAQGWRGGPTEASDPEALARIVLEAADFVACGRGGYAHVRAVLSAGGWSGR